MIALPARENPGAAERIVAQALPAALDEASLDRPASWDAAALRFGEVRAALRRLVTRADPMPPAAVGEVLRDLAARRRQLIPLAPTPARRRL